MMKTTTGFSTSNPMFRSVQMLMYHSPMYQILSSQNVPNQHHRKRLMSLCENWKKWRPIRKSPSMQLCQWEPRSQTTIETKSSQALSVKEDCILEDETGTMELHIWEPLFTPVKSNKAYYFQNLTLRYYQGSKFLSTNRNTTYSEETTILKKIVDPEILTNTEREIIASQLKYVAV